MALEGGSSTQEADSLVVDRNLVAAAGGSPAAAAEKDSFVEVEFDRVVGFVGGSLVVVEGSLDFGSWVAAVEGAFVASIPWASASGIQKEPVEVDRSRLGWLVVDGRRIVVEGLVGGILLGWLVVGGRIVVEGLVVEVEVVGIVVGEALVVEGEVVDIVVAVEAGVECIVEAEDR